MQSLEITLDQLNQTLHFNKIPRLCIKVLQFETHWPKTIMEVLFQLTVMDLKMGYTLILANEIWHKQAKHFQKSFLTSREDTMGAPTPFCFLNVMSKMLRMVHQGERGNQVLDWVSKMVSAIPRAPFFLDFLLSDKTHLVFYYFQLEILKVNMVQLKYGTLCFSFSFQSLKNEINPI